MRTRVQVSVGWGPAPPNLKNLLLAAALAITSTVCAALDIKEYPVPAGSHPHDLAHALDGGVYYASFAGSHIARIDTQTGKVTVIEPPTPNQGARRVWADSQNRIWVSEWRSGQMSRYDPKTNKWRAWKAPGNDPQIYAVYVDNKDIVWLSDFGANATLRFDPKTEQFTVFKSTSRNASVRQILGRPGEVWLPESGADKLVVVRE